jgi:DNA-binding CsgD family transcriptional regulator
MGSESLRVRDIRGVDRVVGECVELWSDPVAWQTHLLREGAKLVGLRVGLYADLRDFDLGQRPQIVSAIDHGWESPAQAAAFFDSRRPGGTEPFGVSPVDLGFRAALGPRRAVTRVRSDLIGDDAWHRDLIYNEVHRPAAMDEIAYSAVRRGGSRFSVLAFGGADRAPAGRQRRVLALLHHEIARRVGSRLTTWTDAGPHRLSDRQREVYALLIEGLDEKTICRRLGRARSTVTEHIAAIYAAFGVQTRSELMAYIIRGRPGATT